MGRLEYLISTGNLYSLDQLLAQNPSLARNGLADEASPLMLACYYQKPEATSLLLKYLDNIDIFEAVSAGKFDVVAYLIYNTPEIVHEFNDEGFTPLALACYFGHYEIARYLMFKGANVNQPLNNNLDIYPIHLAAARNKTDVVSILIEHEAKVNVQQSTGITPLHYAAKNGNIDMMILLLENNADVSMVMEDGIAPAALARQEGFTEIADILS